MTDGFLFPSKDIYACLQLYDKQNLYLHFNKYKLLATYENNNRVIYLPEYR